MYISFNKIRLSIHSTSYVKIYNRRVNTCTTAVCLGATYNLVTQYGGGSQVRDYRVSSAYLRLGVVSVEEKLHGRFVRELDDAHSGVISTDV